jgi:hypothetical protein
MRSHSHADYTPAYGPGMTDDIELPDADDAPPVKPDPEPKSHTDEDELDKLPDESDA